MRLSQGIIPFSPQWHSIRLKRLTSSYLHRIFVSGKSKNELIGQGGRTYIDSKVAEMLTDESESEAPETEDIMRGHALQPFAIERFSEITGYHVHSDLLFEYNSILVGTTDGQICFDGTDEIRYIVEAKAPRAAKHAKVCKVKAPIELRAIDPQYYIQPQSNMLICDAESAFFISYNESVKIYDAQIRIVRLFPDSEWRKDFKNRIDWTADYMCESLEDILKVGELNLQHRLEVEPAEVKKLQSAIESVSSIIKSK
jgi:hypothetical protein